METVLTGCKLGKVLNQNFLLKFDRRNVIRQIKLTLSKFIKKCQSKEVQKARRDKKIAERDFPIKFFCVQVDRIKLLKRFSMFFSDCLGSRQKHI